MPRLSFTNHHFDLSPSIYDGDDSWLLAAPPAAAVIPPFETGIALPEESFETAAPANGGPGGHGDSCANKPYLLEQAFAVPPGAPARQDDWFLRVEPSNTLIHTREADRLVLVWDDSVADARAPIVELVPDPADPDLFEARAGNRIIARVRGDSRIDASDIVLLPLSQARRAGIVPA